MLIRRAEIEGRVLCDVRIENGRIAAVAPHLNAGTDEVLDAEGGCLLPGLHDHHLHLFALAAAERAIRCGPPHVCSAADLSRALRHAAGAPACEARSGDDWLRGVGYHESVAGDLQRTMLDLWVPQRPLRIQHRSGAAWFLNSAGIRALRLDQGIDTAGVERDANGRATGRLFRCDAWLRDALGESVVPSVAAVSLRLARYGVTGITDATAANGPAELDAFATAIARGELLQELHLMGGDDLPSLSHARIRPTARKILLDEAGLPSLDALVETIRSAHAAGRPVAVHCVTRTEIVLACAALADAGSSAADRIEHAAVVAPDVLALLAAARATVVTQPNFVRERGDEYLTDVAERDRPWLYRCAGLLDAGIPVGAGTDAPFGDPDPWLAMQAAVSRITRTGRAFGLEERVTPERALRLFTTPPEAPGGAARKTTVGSAADMCLLDRGWCEARERLRSEDVRATIRAGECVWRRG